MKWATDVAAPASTENEVRVIDPTMGGEDFAFYAQEIPSVFLALGQGAKSFAPEPGLNFDTTVTVHNGRFVLHEDLLRRGVALHALAVLAAPLPKDERNKLCAEPTVGGADGLLMQLGKQLSGAGEADAAGLTRAAEAGRRAVAAVAAADAQEPAAASAAQTACVAAA